MNINKLYNYAVRWTVFSLGMILISGQVSAYEELQHNWVSSETHIIGEGLAGHTLVSYDKQGKRIGEKIYAPNKKLEEEIRYTYNNRKQIIKSEIFNKRGKLQEYAVLSYNSAGQLEQEETFSKKGQALAKEVYEHDSKGKFLSASVFEGKEKVVISKASSYHKGKPKRIDIREVGDSKIQISIVYEYDSKLRLVSQSLFPEGQTSGEAFVKTTYSYK